jgi:membrane protease YdiL (CAAX protease family)
MTAGVLAAEATAVVTADQQERVEAYRWPAALLLHLAPGALVMAGYLALLPLADALRLPPSLALTGAVALIGVPAELGFLLRARRRGPAAQPAGAAASQRSSVGAVAFRRRLPPGRLAALAGSCLAIAGGLYLWLEPVAAGLERHVFGWLPAAWFVGPGSGVSRTAVVAALLVSLVIDGLVGPVVQELYFRGHLMPRLPVAASPAGWLLAPLASAALLAAQHYWQPQLVVFVFAVQVLLGVLVWRTRCLAVAVLVHSAGNVLAVAMTLLTLL